MYDRRKLKGNLCSLSVNQGESKKVRLMDYCGEEFNNIISSFEISGTFCNLILMGGKLNDIVFSGSRQNMQTVDSIDHRYLSGNVYVGIIDTSADVILSPTHPLKMIDSKVLYDMFSLIHICYPDEIEESVSFTNLAGNYTFGYVSDIENGWYLYYQGQKEPYNEKRTWCCINEHPALEPEYLTHEKAFKYCENQTRNNTVYVNREKHIYTNFRRLCTKMDLYSHYSSFGKYTEYGWIAESENVTKQYKIDKNGNLVQLIESNEYARPWCCDDDCLPINYNCKKDRDCCTLNCYLYVCRGKGFIEQKKETIIGKSNIPNWLKYLILILLIYIFGWIMRCCCPKRELLSRHTKLS